MPLNPQARAELAELPSTWRDLEAIESMTAERARALEQNAKGAPAAPPGVAVEELLVAGATGPLRARAHRPASGATVGTVLWMHGGGFVAGSPAMERVPGPLSLASDCAIVSIEYRLAPEHPFPAALEDCHAALLWIGENEDAFGAPIAVAGESAGANLAAATTLMARELGGPGIAAQALLVPALAPDFDGPSRRAPEVGAFARPEAIDWIWDQYLGGQPRKDPLASPLEAASLSGLPPAVIVTAEYDVLRDEGEEYARRLRLAGVPVSARRYDGVYHGFAESATLDAAADCVAFAGAALRSALTASA
jgi:acetyl esterase/lipase